MKIILVNPQIPQNTGNIVRTCAVTGCELILVRPLGFSITDRWLKRAGLDYWEGVQTSILDSLDCLEELLENSTENFYFFSSKAEKIYTEVCFGSKDCLIFGSETHGLPEKFRQRWPERYCRIPMLPEARCLNLATSVGIITYEAWSQQNFMLPPE